MPLPRFSFWNHFASKTTGVAIASTRPPQHYKYCNRNINLVACTSDGVILEAICPENAFAGVKIEIEYDGMKYYVAVPRGISFGMKFQVKIPKLVEIATEVENTIIINSEKYHT